MAIKDLSGRSAARARRDAQVYGKVALPSKGSATAGVAAAATAPTASAPRRSASTPSSTSGSCREASLARRRQMSSKGKAGAASSDRQRSAGNRSAAAAKAKASTEKGCGCGCNGEGKCKDTAAAPVASVAKPAMSMQAKKVNVVSPSNTGRMNSRLRRQALAAHGKKGVDIMNNGVSSAQMARTQNPDISSRDLARSVRAQRSVSGGSAAKAKSAPVRGNRPKPNPDEVTGTQVAHSAKTTGDEIGLCRSITGTDYLSDDTLADYCQSGSGQFSAPSKVLTSALSRGGNITTASSVGRSGSVTGDEHGSCKNVTGTEYLGTEHFEQFCGTAPTTGPAKVSFSQTTRGKIVSGSKPARSEQVTGDEAGTCKAVTGTPYAGSEQYEKYCEPNQAQVAVARNELRRGNAGRDITGVQPGLANLTGAAKGVCKPLTGTSYVGASDHQQVCGASPAQMGESDFPKPLAGAPWGEFSVETPNHASQTAAEHNAVTGSQYEQGRISGTFSLGEGKLTGTEEARFGNTGAANAPVDISKSGHGVTGEGIDTGLNITGDDWDRNDRVTGTEGRSSTKRNPTRRGPISAMTPPDNKRNTEVEPADLNVTGSHGNTDKGAMITVSGGARG